MDDIVERLRGKFLYKADFEEAAAEIERLRAMVDRLRGELDRVAGIYESEDKRLDKEMTALEAERIVERSPAMTALLTYKQADIDGVMVRVPRQAIHEVADEVERLRAQNERQKALLEELHASRNAWWKALDAAQAQRDDWRNRYEALKAQHKDELRVMWQAWMELNEIRARDGVPYKFDGTKSSVCELYFSRVVDELSDCLGIYAKPWPPETTDRGLAQQHKEPAE